RVRASLIGSATPGRSATMFARINSVGDLIGKGPRVSVGDTSQGGAYWSALIEDPAPAKTGRATIEPKLARVFLRKSRFFTVIQIRHSKSYGNANTYPKATFGIKDGSVRKTKKGNFGSPFFVFFLFSQQA